MRLGLTVLVLAVIASAVWLLRDDMGRPANDSVRELDDGARDPSLLDGTGAAALHVSGTMPAVEPAAEPVPTIPLAVRTATLALDVVGPDGRSVPSALVLVSVPGREAALRHSWSPTRRVVAVPPEPLQVTARRRDMRPSGTVEVDASLGSASVSLRLTTPQVVAGTVRAPHGVRLDNLIVLALPLEGRHVTEWTHVDDYPKALRTSVRRLEPTYSLGLGQGQFLMAVSYGELVHLQGVVDMQDTGIKKDLRAPPVSPAFSKMHITGLTPRRASRMVVKVTRVRDDAKETVVAVVIPTTDGAYWVRATGHQDDDRELVARVRVPGASGHASFEAGRGFALRLKDTPKPKSVAFDVEVRSEGGSIVGTKLVVRKAGTVGPGAVVHRDIVMCATFTLRAVPGKYQIILGDRTSKMIEVDEGTQAKGPIIVNLSRTYGIEVRGVKSGTLVMLMSAIDPDVGGKIVFSHRSAKANERDVATFTHLPPGRYVAAQETRTVRFTVPDELSVRLPSR